MKNERKTDHTLLLMLVALFVFHSPFASWWLGLNLPWYTIFVIWGLLLVLVWHNQRRLPPDHRH